MRNMREKVSFFSNGLKLAGELFTPEGNGDGSGRPGIVVSHPVTSVKEQSPAFYARRLADNGFVVLTFDAAFQGESEGQPHFLEDPFIRSENVKDAVSYLVSRDEVRRRTGRGARHLRLRGLCALRRVDRPPDAAHPHDRGRSDEGPAAQHDA
ncbi:alpha/beta hydrolase [Streptomyces sp. SID4985]|uniref:alpha/beta hydrolase n=1 Tax=Streptomyces sp. SID4985 TaxID=2690292 RepID=UPI0031B9EDC4